MWQKSRLLVCALCKGNHLVDYRGCLIFKNVQRLRKQQLTSINNASKIEENCNNIPMLYPTDNSTSRSNNINNSQTYAQATKSNTNSSHAKNDTQNQFIESVLTLLFEKFLNSHYSTHFTLKYSN